MSRLFFLKKDTYQTTLNTKFNLQEIKYDPSTWSYAFPRSVVPEPLLLIFDILFDLCNIPVELGTENFKCSGTCYTFMCIVYVFYFYI